MNEFSVITIMNEATINVLKSKKVDCSINLKKKKILMYVFFGTKILHII